MPEDDHRIALVLRSQPTPEIKSLAAQRWKTRQSWERAKDTPKPKTRRAKRRRGMQKARWQTVTVTYVCPVCGGDHLRNDHDRATDTLLNRTRKATR